MAVGLGEEAPFYLELEALGMVRRTVRKVLETRRNLARDPKMLDTSKWSTAENIEAVTLDGSWSRNVTDTALKQTMVVGSVHAESEALGDCVPGEKITLGMSYATSSGYRASHRIYWYDAGNSFMANDQISVTPETEKTFVRGVLTAKAPEGAATFRSSVWIAPNPPSAAIELFQNGMTVEQGETGGTYFDGDTPDTGGWEYRWEGVPNNSVSIAERVEYVDVRGDVSEGAPRTRLTVYNVPDGSVMELRWSSGGESGPVQGHRVWRMSGVGIAIDWAVPLNREVTYTVVVEGQIMSTASLTVFSDVAWIQDPLHPDGALPVHSTRIVKGYLLLDSKAISNATYSNNGDSAQIMGSRYPRFNAGLRSAASDVSVTMWSDDEPTEAAFRNMVLEAPVLLLRPLPRHRLLPPLAYIAGDVNEDQITVRLGADLTHWTFAGNLVQAVLQAAQSGFITYGQVQELLGGYTYGEAQTAAKSTTYLDWQKNPLIFQNL